MTESRERIAAKANQPKLFLDVLKARLAKFQWQDGSALTLEKFCPLSSIVNRRILTDYGAIFVSAFAGEEKFYSSCSFKNEDALQTIQRDILAGSEPQIIGGVKIELQPEAMKALLKAIDEAKKQNLNITPRGGSMAARRSFAETVSLWNSRVNPGLNHWVRMGKLSAAEARRIRTLDASMQVAHILELEERGLYFSTDFSKSILYSVAMPGASQHNWLLALDVAQFGNPKVREILAKHGWFQTIYSDLPHFTYLGVKEPDPNIRGKKLQSLGLQSKTIGNQVFWIPRMEAAE